MSLHECPDCDNVVATNSTTAGAFEMAPDIVCVDCGVVMNCDADVKVDMDKVRQ